MTRLILLLILLAAPASAWWPKGHSLLTEAAVRALPQNEAGRKANLALPRFFIVGAATIAHCAQDPDVFKNRALPHLTDREYADHFIDWELLGNRELPEKRSQFMEMCAREKLDPEDIGFLPYAVAENTERLAIAFAEYRKWPQNKHIQLKCLVYAGHLAHYAGDLQMPLHTTIHFDGRANADGTSPKTKIHERLDSLVEKLAEKKLISAKSLAQNQIITPLAEPLLLAILDEVQRSRAQIDRAYELENLLPPTQANQAWIPDAKIVEFGTQRGREASRFTAALYLTAWRLSASVNLPVWLER